MLQISPPLAHVLPHQTSPTATTSPSVFSTLHSHSRSLSLSSVAAGLDLEPRWLIQSPYIERDHQLDLWTLDHEAALLARALATLRPTRSDYAQAPYRDGFNWDEVAEKLRELAASNGKNPSQYREMSFYIVVFRSQIPPETTYEDLGLLDKPAHAEAIASGGFLKSVSHETNQLIWLFIVCFFFPSFVVVAHNPQILVRQPRCPREKLGYLYLAVPPRRRPGQQGPVAQEGGASYRVTVLILED